MQVITALVFVLLFGIVFSKIAQLIRIPYIIGYLIAGVIIGPSVLGLIDPYQVSTMETFSIITLSVLSFIVGSELRFSYLKKIGSKPIITAIFTSFTTFIVITVSMIFLLKDLSSALILGVIGAATAPAVIMNIFKKYKTKGELTETILSIVAIDDIVSIILFGLILTILESSGTNLNILSLLMPFVEIILSFIIGSVLGITLGMVSRIFKGYTYSFALILVFILSSIAITDYFEMSSLLTCTIMGIMFVNFSSVKVANNILDVTDEILSLVLIVFFVISGSELNINIIPSIWKISLGFIVVRIIGKYLGALLGSKITGMNSKISSVLGLCLLSQTGLTVGLLLAASKVLGDNYEIVQGIVIFTSIIIDIISPIILKIILKQKGEIPAKLKISVDEDI